MPENVAHANLLLQLRGGRWTSLLVCLRAHLDDKHENSAHSTVKHGREECAQFSKYACKRTKQGGVEYIEVTDMLLYYD
jgi:hypothetical protein